MTPEGEAAFRAFLQRRTGFVMPEDRWRFLAPRFLSRLADRGFAGVEPFVRYLEHDPRGRTELEEIFNVLTVRKTSFFRNPGCFLALERDILPRLVAGRRSRIPISLWSAGCSTGEEAYSLAIVAQAALAGQDLPFHVLATDIVKEALARAKDGSYPEQAIDEVPLAHRRWLRASGGRVTVVDEVKEKIELAVHNLVYDGTPRPASGTWDVILCRNVLIYFGLKEARDVIDRFASVLSPGGVLILGHAEVFMDLERDFEVVFWGDTFYYRRRVDARVTAVTSSGSDLGRVDDHVGGRTSAAYAAAQAAARTSSDRLDAVRADTRSLPRPRLDAQPTGASDRLDLVRPARPGIPAPSERLEAQRPEARSTPRSQARPGAASASGRTPPPLPPPPLPQAPAPDGLSETRRWRRERDTPTEARSRADLPGAPRPSAEGGRQARLDAPSKTKGPPGETPTRAFARPSGAGAVSPSTSAYDEVEDDTRADLRIGQSPLPLEQVQDAARRLEADDREGAARQLRAAITRAPRWARPRVLLARVYLRTGEVEHAMRQLETAIEVEPLDARAHHLLGAVRASQGEPQKAEASLRSALYLEPDLVHARWALARVYRDLGHPERAVRELRNVVRALRTLTGARLEQVLDGTPLDDLRERCEAEITALGGSLDESGIFPI